MARPARRRAGREPGYRANNADWLDGRWADIKAARDYDDPRRGRTGVEIETLKEIGEKITAAPKGFHVHRTIQRFLDAARKSIKTGEGIDWATGEALAFCSLLLDGRPVRLSGQDTERGTFSQRHSVLVDQENEDRYIPFNHVREGQARFEVINSMLSEEAVVGFEYGYSLAEPDALTLWEAQFGDFANGAQVVFDQFISSGERKWLRMSGLGLPALPHGYEGQGPEHSSARLERFLQMCAEDNMQVANCTTPANYFHILRRQLKRDIRKPLILMTPKSLLRHKRAVSRLDEMGPGTTFHRLAVGRRPALPDEKIKLVADDKIRRVVMCSGKVYYDLYEEREKRGIDDVYLLRDRAALPGAAQGAGAGARPLPEGAAHVVPGRAAQHGRLLVHGALSRMGARPDRRRPPAAALRRPAGLGGDRGRPDVAASQAAQGAAGRGAGITPRCHAGASWHPVIREVRQGNERPCSDHRFREGWKVRFLVDKDVSEHEQIGSKGTLFTSAKPSLSRMMTAWSRAAGKKTIMAEIRVPTLGDRSPRRPLASGSRNPATRSRSTSRWSSSRPTR